MKYQYRKEIMNDSRSRAAFNRLAGDTFHLSFEPWYQAGWWSPRYHPYTLFDGDAAIANVSANRMVILWGGRRFQMIQLGTVMTDEAYRGQGLSRLLLEAVIEAEIGQTDAIYLFANQSVLDFYPRFGFQKLLQYQSGMKLAKAAGEAVRLDPDQAEDVAVLRRCYQKRNPFSRLQSVDYFGLLMFYCMAPMKRHIYYSAAYDAVMIAERKGEVCHCYEIYSDAGQDFMALLEAMAPEGCNTVEFHFTPSPEYEYQYTEVEPERDTLFVRNGNSDIAALLAAGKYMFPELSHA